METLFRAGVSNAVSATILAIVVACLSRPLARRPAIVHGLWLLVLLKLVTPPLYEVPIPWPALSRSRGQTVAAGPVAPTTVESSVMIEVPAEVFVFDGDFAADRRNEARADSSWDERSATEWATPIVAIWLAGTAMIVVLSIRRILRFQGLLRQTRPASQPEQGRVDAMASRLGLRRGPVLEWVRAKLSPMIWSMGWRPRLIVPKDLWKTLDEPQRSTLIVHELAHLRRGDHWVRYFELVVTALFWWHPVVWWVRQALRDAEEECCDAWVVWAFPDAARSYAETLLETIDFLDKSMGPEPLLASGFGKVHHLRRRLTMILSESTSRRLGGWGMLGLFGLAVMMLPVNATWAQKAEEPQKTEVVVKSATATDGPADALVGAYAYSYQIDTQATAAPEGQVVVKFDTVELPDVQFSGSIEQSILQFKKLISEIEAKSPVSEQDQQRRKALQKAIELLAQLAPPGKETSKPLMMMIRSLDDNSPTKPASEAEKAAIDKLQSRVKALTDELLAKQKELTDAQAQLAKLKGVNAADMHVVRQLRVTRLPDAKAARRVVAKQELETQVSDGKPPKTAETEIKKAGPTKARVEVMIKADGGLEKGEKVPLGVVKSETVKINPAPTDQQRIEAIEKKLKALLDELDHLKSSNRLDTRFAPTQ